MKNRIVSNTAASKRARQISAGPFPGGFSWISSGDAPGRVSFADEVIRMRHTGWFCDAYQGDKARGVVVRLPRGRFLAGYAAEYRGIYGVSAQIFSTADAQIFSTAEDAAHDADEQARIYAEKEFEYSEVWQEGAILRDVIEKKKNDVLELFSARHNKRVRSDIRETIADIRAFEVEFKDLCTRHGLEY